MKRTLLIDTSDNKLIKVGLRMGEKEDLRVQPVDQRRAQVVLPLVELLLEKHNLTLTDLTEIEVTDGPGSFTGLRVGVTIANTLAYLLKIPLNGEKIGEMVEPRYT